MKTRLKLDYIIQLFGNDGMSCTRQRYIDFNLPRVYLGLGFNTPSDCHLLCLLSTYCSYCSWFMHTEITCGLITQLSFQKSDSVSSKSLFIRKQYPKSHLIWPIRPDLGLSGHGLYSTERVLTRQTVTSKVSEVRVNLRKLSEERLDSLISATDLLSTCVQTSDDLDLFKTQFLRCQITPP